VYGAGEPPYKGFFVSNGAAPASTAGAAAAIGTPAATVSVGPPVLTVTRPDVLAASVAVPVGQSRFYRRSDPAGGARPHALQTMPRRPSRE